MLTLLLTDWLVSASPDQAGALTGYTLEQVAEHAEVADCWMAIEGQVYDVSEYIPHHPTTPSLIASWCGKEATEGMRTKGYGRDHSSAGWAALDEYLVGELADE